MRNHPTDLRGADLSGARLIDARADGTDLRGAALRDATLRGANLQSAKLDGADLQRVLANDAVLRRASFLDAVLDSADLRDADLTGARHLSSAGITRALIEGASLARVDLGAVELDFSNVCLARVNFEGVRLRKARFRLAYAYEARHEYRPLGMVSGDVSLVVDPV